MTIAVTPLVRTRFFFFIFNFSDECIEYTMKLGYLSLLYYVINSMVYHISYYIIMDQRCAALATPAELGVLRDGAALTTVIINICMCVYIYIYIYMYTYVYIYIYIYLYVSLPLSLSLSIYIYICTLMII